VTSLGFMKLYESTLQIICRGTNKMNKIICNRGDVVGVIRDDRARLAGVFSPSPKYDSARIN
jgi:hypothetical protein